MLGKIDYGVMSITPSLGGSTLQLSSGITQGARHAHRPSIWMRCWLLSTKGVDNRTDAYAPPPSWHGLGTPHSWSIARSASTRKLFG